MTSRDTTYLGIAAVLAGIGVAAVSLVPAVEFAYRSPTVHSAIETAAVFVSLLVTYLVFGRYRGTRTAGDLRLTLALALLAAANVASAVTPTVSESGADAAAVWVPLACQLLAACALVFAALRAGTEAPAARPRRLAGVAGLALGAAIGLGLLAATTLSTGIDPELSPAASGSPRLTGAAPVLGGQLGIMALLVLSSRGFARRARSTGDELMFWLALGTLLGSFARLNYFLFPSNYSDFVFTGDILRLAFYLAILVGALRQIAIYQRAAAEAAVLEERRRIARDLHDGLAQDLAFISMKGRRLSAQDPGVGEMVDAAERALADSRGAIMALAERTDEPLAGSIARIGGTLAGRRGATLRLQADEQLAVDPPRREAILRIVSEAISNATRHGEASEITIQLHGADGIRLLVADNGCGFDVETLRDSAGLGIAGIRERAERLGGRTEVRSRLGEGTEVEVVFR